jgi:hypothetical protein
MGMACAAWLGWVSARELVNSAPLCDEGEGRAEAADGLAASW